MPKSMTLSQSTTRSPLLRLLVPLFLLAIALTCTIPGYLGQPWPWQQVPKISQIAQLNALQKTGLELPGWQTLEQKVVEIGGHKWSAQAIIPASVLGQTHTKVHISISTNFGRFIANGLINQSLLRKRLTALALCKSGLCYS